MIERKPYAVVDIDGTIADTSERFNIATEKCPHPESGRGRLTPCFWDAFMDPELAMRDKPIEGTARAVNKLAEKYHIVYLSGRRAAMQEVTERWLRVNGYPYTPDRATVILRPKGKGTLEWKGKFLSQIAKSGKVKVFISDSEYETRFAEGLEIETVLLVKMNEPWSIPMN